MQDVSEFHHFFLQRVHEGLSAPPPGHEPPHAAAAVVVGGGGALGQEGKEKKEGGVVESIFGGTMRQEVFVQAGPDQLAPATPGSPAAEQGGAAGGTRAELVTAAGATVSTSTAEFMELILGLGPGSLHGTADAATGRPGYRRGYVYMLLLLLLGYRRGYVYMLLSIAGAVQSWVIGVAMYICRAILGYRRGGVIDADGWLARLLGRLGCGVRGGAGRDVTGVTRTN